MARPRYPSDETRRTRQRPHVKIHLSVRNHRKTAGHFDNPEFRGQYLALMMLAVERFAAQNGGKLRLSRSDVSWISGRHRRDIAESTVSQLLDILEYPYERCGDVLSITIPKLAKKQGFGVAEFAESPRSPRSTDGSEEPKNRRTEEPIKKGTPSPRSARSPCVFPEPFPPEHRESLLAWGSVRFSEAQVDHAIGVVRDWALSGGHKRTDWVATVRNGMQRGWALEGMSPAGLSPEEELPRGQAYAPEDDPRERARKMERRRLERQVEAETEERERRFGRQRMARGF